MAKNDQSQSRRLMSMNSLQRVHSFIRKTPEQRWTTVRFLSTMWLAKLPYAPHRVLFAVTPNEQVHFWWSYFPPSFNSDRSAFEYWGDDIGDLRFLWKFLQPGMTFLDIGAYHGAYSVIAAKKLGRSGRVIAFEPSPRERQRMRLHLRYNRIKLVTLEPYALAAEEGVASLAVVVDGFTTMNSLRPPLIGHPIKQVMVDTTSLDAYMDREQIDRVDLMKIDTEGGEVQAFRGADQLLSRLRPLIICEVLDLVTRPWGYAAADIISLLQNCDYRWFDILPDGRLLPHHPKQAYPDGGNYLAVPLEKQDRISSAVLPPTFPQAGGTECASF
jgi:FkbM family methyltransferase